MKTCSRCILPESYPGIEFGEEGVCNHCLSFKRRIPMGEEKLLRIIDSYRDGSRKYDCMVAYSGGRDSSYLLWYAKRRLGLRVLACFVDNGFVPDQTLTNIRNVTEVLDTDPSVLLIYAKEYIFRWVPFLRKLMTRKVAYPRMRVLEPFYYVEWDEDEIVSVIQNELGWEKCSYSGSSWRSDCEIATMKNYLYRRTQGFSKLDELLSSMIRCDMTTREEAVARLERESFISEDFVRDFIEGIDLDYASFRESLDGKGL